MVILNMNDVDQRYDYIVIGSGPSGATMAKMLTDDENFSVLLLETGDNNTEDEAIRVSYTEIWRYFPQYFWQGRSAAEINTGQRSFNWSTGRTLGGGSSVNGQQYVRPSPDYFREWERYAGPIWSLRSAVKEFTRIEQFHGQTYHPEFHGYYGRVSIRQAPEQIPAVTEKFVNAITQATGYPPILDYNDPNTPIGPFYQWQLYQKPDGSRESSATAFLSSDIITPEGQGINGRRLTVYTKTTVLRILFNDEKEAIGVEMLRDGYQQRVLSSKGVILCAGINDSQLLMLSGIGPANHLEKMGIPLVYDNPNVGKHMNNHTIHSASFSINPSDLVEARMDRNALYNGGAFLPLPDYTPSQHRGVQLIGEIRNDRFNISFINLLPSSRGSISLQNSDPLKIALVDYGFLNYPRDMDMIMNAYRTYIIPIAEMLSEIDPSYQLISPTYDTINNDALLADYIRRNLQIAYHQQTFNRMSPDEQRGVVNQWGEVYGVKGLIIADSSILPFPVDCNTSSTSYLIASIIATQLIQQNIDSLQFTYPSYPPHYEI